MKNFYFINIDKKKMMQIRNIPISKFLLSKIDTTVIQCSLFLVNLGHFVLQASTVSCLEIFGFKWFVCFSLFTCPIIKYQFSIFPSNNIYSEMHHSIKVPLKLLKVSFKAIEKILYKVNFSWCFP